MSKHDDEPSGQGRLAPAAWRLALAACALSISLGCTSAPAHALPVRGDEFGFAFGAEGAAGTTLSNPGDVAVDEASGDAYVLDRGNNRVVRYGPKGEFVAAWGWDVNAARKGKSKYEVCESDCQAGEAGRAKYQLNGNAVAIAVDNSTQTGDKSAGDVYVLTEYADKTEEEGLTKEEEETGGHVHVDSAHEAIDKFSPNGEKLEQTDEARYEIREESGGKIEKEKQAIELEPAHSYGLAVAPNGSVWLYYEEGLYDLGDKKLSEDHNPPPLEASLNGEPAPGLVIDTSEQFYLGEEIEGAIPGTHKDAIWEGAVETVAGEPELEEVEATEELERQVGNSGFAVDSARGEIYLDSGTSITELEPGGALREQFGDEQREGHPVLEKGGAVAVSASAREVFVADTATNAIDVFIPEEPGPPTVEGVSTQGVTAEAAQLDATIDPRGLRVSYFFEYGTAPCPGACTRVPGGEIGGEGFGEEGFGEEGVDVRLQEGTSAPVLPNTTYHYRVVAESEGGGGGPVSAEGAFTTLPTSGASTADGRMWEMVSPPDKDGADVDPVGEELPGPIQAAADGGAITYIANGPFAEPEGSRSLETTQILSVRGEHGWTSKDIVTPNSAGTGLELKRPAEYQFFSPSLSLALLTPAQSGGMLAEPPLAPPVSEAEKALAAEGKDYQEKTIYLRDDSPLEPQGEAEAALYHEAEANGARMGNPGYLALLTGADAPGAEFGGENLKFAGATASLSHVVVESKAPLQTGEVTEGLYEWSKESGKEATLEPINVLEDDTFEGGAYLGAVSTGGATAARNLNHAISENGSHIFWGSDGRLYMRDMTKTPEPETIRLDKVQQGKGEGPVHAVFQTASVAGSRVFFTDEQKLTEGSGAGAGMPDLYMCEIVENHSGRLECGLRDLTPERATGEGGESADVQDGDSEEDVGGVLGASEDGSYVYFVANGVLSEAPNAQGEHASPGHCGVEGYPRATCNLYAEHYDSELHEWEAPSFIAALSSDDEPDWAAEGQGRLTARVSPNGRYLAFMSDRPLSSFGGHSYSTDATAADAHGAPAEEVYLYDASSGRIVCASCEPSGARPLGVHDPSAGEGASLFVDESKTWEGRWLAGSLPEWPGISQKSTRALYENRVLSDSGRLFFNSPEELVSQAANGEEDVYEYEPTGVPRGAHECTAHSATYSERSEGCVGLISSGESTSESAFLDASEVGGEGEHGEELQEGGGDVFFVTAAKLAPQDTDGAYDVYDAHECTAAEPCRPSQQGTPPTPCKSAESCRPFSYSPPAGGAPASATHTGQGVLPIVEKKPPQETRAQKLAKALKACRNRYAHSRKKRAACERTARKKYGPVKSKHAKNSDVHGARKRGALR